MNPKFKLVKNLAKLIFCLGNTQIFLLKWPPYRKAKLRSMTLNDWQECRIINKMAANTKDRRCLNLLSPITFRIFSCFAIPFSQSNTLLNSTKLKAMTIIGSEAEQISWRHMTSSAFVWSFNSFPVSREKALLKWPKFKKLFERHICKV